MMLMVTFLSVWFLLILFVARALIYAYRHFRFHASSGLKLKQADMPSVSICIPARNETHAMVQCLERAIASTYPKLEIIVLDDESHDNTSILIKSFAHAGVRFVKGDTLPDGWLGKNFALDDLLREASGTYVFFMGVDTQLSPTTVEQLVGRIETTKAAMISVIPQRRDTGRRSAFFGALRSFWTLLFHDKAAPAVASEAWMVNRRRLLEASDGFAALKHAVQPEAYFAALFSKTNEYRFYASTPELGLYYEKKWSSQIETGLRLLYPLFGGKPLGILFGTSVLLIGLAPFVVVLLDSLLGWNIYAPGMLLLCATEIILYGSYLHIVWAQKAWIGAFALPYTLAQEIVILCVSAYKYGQRTITWKGRPIENAAKNMYVR